MQITAKMVKELRDKTSVGMMKCKEALIECKGDIEAAVDHLRKKGLASADKRSGRATSEGIILPITTDDRRTAVMVEVNSETDFVARNEDFAAFANKIADFAIATPNINNFEDLEKATIEGQTGDELRKSMIAVTGENISYGRLEKLSIPEGTHGIFDSYMHGEGSIGVLVQLSCENEATAKHEDTINFAHEVALQAAAMKPLYTHRKEVPTEALAREKDVITAQIKNDPKNANKPDEIINKIIEGRLGKYFQENCLLEQSYVKDDGKTINDLAEDFSKKVGGKISVVTYRRWALGENTDEQVTTEEQTNEAAG